jgi:hypothetical protein
MRLGKKDKNPATVIWMAQEKKDKDIPTINSVGKGRKNPPFRNLDEAWEKKDKNSTTES